MGYFAGIRKLKMPPKNVQATIKLVKRCLTFFTKHALVQPEKEIHRLLQNNEGNYLFIDMGGALNSLNHFWNCGVETGNWNSWINVRRKKRGKLIQFHRFANIMKAVLLCFLEGLFNVKESNEGAIKTEMCSYYCCVKRWSKQEGFIRFLPNALVWVGVSSTMNLWAPLDPGKHTF